MLSEQQIQKSLLNYLETKQGYSSHKGNVYVEDLHPYFRDQINRLNNINLKNTPLTDKEFNRLLTNMEVKPTVAFKQFRHGVELVRDDNTNIIIKLYDTANEDNNVFTVVEELKVKGIRENIRHHIRDKLKKRPTRNTSTIPRRPNETKQKQRNRPTHSLKHAPNRFRRKNTQHNLPRQKPRIPQPTISRTNRTHQNT